VNGYDNDKSQAEFLEEVRRFGDYFQVESRMSLGELAFQQTPEGNTERVKKTSLVQIMQFPDLKILQL